MSEGVEELICSVSHWEQTNDLSYGYKFPAQTELHLFKCFLEMSQAVSLPSQDYTRNSTLRGLERSAVQMPIETKLERLDLAFIYLLKYSETFLMCSTQGWEKTGL